MTVAIMILDLFYENAQNLKDKRRILLSIKEKLRNKFNVSLIESNYQNLWQKIQLTIVMAANNKVMAQKSLNQIEDFILANYPVQFISLNKEFI